MCVQAESCVPNLVTLITIGLQFMAWGNVLEDGLQNVLLNGKFCMSIWSASLRLHFLSAQLIYASGVSPAEGGTSNMQIM